VTLALLVASPARGEPDAHLARLVPENAVLSVRLSSFDALASHPIFDRIAGALRDSREARRALDAMPVDERLAPLLALAEDLELTPYELLEELTSSGAALGLTAELPPKLVGGLACRDADFAGRLVTTLREIAEQSGTVRVEQSRHRDVDCYRVGDACLAATGTRIVIASQPETLKAALDRLLDPPSTPVPEVPTGLTAQANLFALRFVPQVAQALQFPGADANAMTFLGGWLDLLRRHDRLTLSVTPDGDRLTIDVRVLAPNAYPRTTALEGFFADQPAEAPAPPFELPGTIFSATWYRDYASLWNARRQLVTGAIADKLEQGDEQAATQLEVFGTHVRPSDLFAQVGPRFRVVVARQAQPPYKVEVPDRLPAAALAVDLRDEAKFREMTSPIFRTFSLILNGEQRIATDEIDYRDARLVRLSLSEDPAEQARGAKVRYNLRTTYAITRGHFILGSTPEIVQQVIDAIDAQQTGPAAGPNHSTEQQRLDLAELAAALGGVREALLRGLILSGGWDSADAEHEIRVWTGLLASLGVVTTTAAAEPDGFRYRVTIGPQ
jgi:hypothetical protein